jgi:hypothetical protein
MGGMRTGSRPSLPWAWGHPIGSHNLFAPALATLLPPLHRTLARRAGGGTVRGILTPAGVPTYLTDKIWPDTLNSCSNHVPAVKGDGPHER